MRAGPDLAWSASTGFSPTSCMRSAAVSPKRVESRLPMKSGFCADIIRPKPDIVGRHAAVEFAMGDMALLDAQHVQRLDPVGADAMRPARLHDRIRHRLAIARGHRQLVGQFAGEGDAEQPRLQRRPSA